MVISESDFKQYLGRSNSHQHSHNSIERQNEKQLSFRWRKKNIKFNICFIQMHWWNYRKWNHYKSALTYFDAKFRFDSDSSHSVFTLNIILTILHVVLIYFHVFFPPWQNYTLKVYAIISIFSLSLASFSLVTIQNYTRLQRNSIK